MCEIYAIGLPHDEGPALIRSDRLRAAKKYLDRLDQLAPGNQEIRELKGLLARFAPRDSTPGEQEIEP